MLIVPLLPNLAQASLSRVGPVDPANGYPSFYEDANGLRLRYCDDPNAGCAAAELPNPDAPLSFPDNYPAEAFYFLAESSPRPGALLVLAQEGAFLTGETAASGDQMVFARVRIRVSGLVAGATYHITHPYGQLDLTANSTGVINNTVDTGCAVAPCDFTLAQNGFIGDAGATSAPFLRWDPSVAPAAPPGTIGDLNTAHRVIGSPFDTNYFRVEGPNAGGPGVDVLESNQFSVEGQIAPPAAPGTPSTPDLAAASDSGSSATDNITNIASPTFTGTASDGATVTVLVDGTEAGSGTAIGGNYSITPSVALAQGTHLIAARVDNPAFDPVNAPDEPQFLSSGTLSIKVDTAAPVSSIGFPRPSNPTADRTPTLVFSSNEAASTFECSLKTDADLFEPCSSPDTYDEQLDGLYTFKVRATDQAGNTGTPASYQFRIGSPDTTAPTVSASPAGGTYNTAQSVTLTASEPANIFYTTNGTTPTTASTQYTGPISISASTSLKFMAVDAAGNQSAVVTQNYTINTNTAPGAPTIGNATAGKASATVRWTAPTSNGGSAITGYRVRVLNTATGGQVGTLRSAAANVRSLQVTGLTNGTSYAFRVAAVNAVGRGAFSAQSNTVTPATVPGKPIIGTAASGAAGGALTAIARWSPPASNGGAPITGYVVTALKMSASGTVLSRTNSPLLGPSARSRTITLPAGNYRFQVRAQNRVGNSPLSARSNLVAAR